VKCGRRDAVTGDLLVRLTTRIIVSKNSADRSRGPAPAMDYD
jgi:hypothetical protein